MTGASNLSAIVAALTFAAVILSIAFNWLDLAVAGLLGAILLRVLGIVSQGTAVSSINAGYDTIGLFFAAWWWRAPWFRLEFSTTSARRFCVRSVATGACC
jgi:hypothetical protein